ncbi:unnamed protein product, partial [Discosporangium mesarthrocarpum]
MARDGYGYDYVMVFPVESKGEMTKFAISTVQQINRAGLQTRVYFGVQNNEMFVEMRAPLERLMKFADQVDRKILLDRSEVEKAATAGNPEAGIMPIEINNDTGITSMSPYEFIYAKYDRDPCVKHLYACARGVHHPFRTTVRLSLIVDILKAPTRVGGAGLMVDKLKIKGAILAFFPKH